MTQYIFYYTIVFNILMYEKANLLQSTVGTISSFSKFMVMATRHKHSHRGNRHRQQTENQEKRDNTRFSSLGEDGRGGSGGSYRRDFTVRNVRCTRWIRLSRAVRRLSIVSMRLPSSYSSTVMGRLVRSPAPHHVNYVESTMCFVCSHANSDLIFSGAVEKVVKIDVFSVS